jgi:hypothetical protein
MANLSIPLTDELAADIFMGSFTENFVNSAKIAATELKGTLYQSYYAAPFEAILGMPQTDGERFDKKVSQSFLRFCEGMAGTTYGGYSPANNGRIIEQQQVLTTHNLAALVTQLELHEHIRSHAYSYAQTAANWIFKRLQLDITEWVPQLRNMKNAAYAWRQMIFFLSYTDKSTQGDFIKWLDELLMKMEKDNTKRFTPLLNGLKRAYSGESPIAPVKGATVGVEDAIRFTGWSDGAHWLCKK